MKNCCNLYIGMGKMLCFVLLYHIVHSFVKKRICGYLWKKRSKRKGMHLKTLLDFFHLFLL